MFRLKGGNNFMNFSEEHMGMFSSSEQTIAITIERILTNEFNFGPEIMNDEKGIGLMAAPLNQVTIKYRELNGNALTEKLISEMTDILIKFFRLVFGPVSINEWSAAQENLPVEMKKVCWVYTRKAKGKMSELSEILAKRLMLDKRWLMLKKEKILLPKVS